MDALIQRAVIEAKAKMTSKGTAPERAEMHARRNVNDAVKVGDQFSPRFTTFSREEKVTYRRRLLETIGVSTETAKLLADACEPS